jgi:hypothetical protein
MAIAGALPYVETGKKSALVRLIGGIMAPNRVAGCNRSLHTINGPGNRISKGGNHGNQHPRRIFSNTTQRAATR